MQREAANLADDFGDICDAVEMGEPTGRLSCGMPYWLPDGVTLAGVAKFFDNPQAVPGAPDLLPKLGVLDHGR